MQVDLAREAQQNGRHGGGLRVCWVLECFWEKWVGLQVGRSGGTGGLG